MTKVPSRDWNAIAWPAVSAGDAARWIAVLPLAATEQHGPHLPLETDVMIGEAYLARVKELLPPTLPVSFLPVQKIGISTEHTDYPGTQTLSTEAALRQWMALGEGVARAGVKKCVMVTSHAHAVAPRIFARLRAAARRPQIFHRHCGKCVTPAGVSVAAMQCRARGRRCNLSRSYGEGERSGSVRAWCVLFRSRDQDHCPLARMDTEEP